MKQLILQVDQLDQGAQPIEVDLPRELLDEVLRAEPPTEFHAGGLAHLIAKATKMGRKVLVQGTFSLPLSGQCKRCLKPVALEAPAELTRSYVPADTLPVPREKKAGRAGAKGDKPGKRNHALDSEPEASFDPQLVDEEGYGGKEIDLRPAVREQVLLSIPPSPVCREDCKGLCPNCGKDLNEGECGCDRVAVDPRWAGLKAIQLETKKKES